MRSPGSIGLATSVAETDATAIMASSITITALTMAGCR
jgi:hypothetical protein